MFDITSGLVTLHVARTLGSTVMLGIMLFLSLPAATYALVPSPTLSLTTNPVQVGKGGAATLSWASQHTTSCTASAGWSGSKGTSGSQTVKNINSSQTYNLTCAGTTKTVSATVKVTVASTSPRVQPVVGLVVGLNVQQQSGTFDAAGQAFTIELGAHSLRLAHGDHNFGVNWAAQNGKSVLFMLGYGSGCNPRTESGRQCYADRSAGLVQKYGNKVQYWEVWNEWDGGLGLGVNWTQAPANDPVMYTDLLCKTYKAIKAVRPSAIVAGGVVTGSSQSFVTGMLNAGAGDCMDMFSQHLYMYAQNRPYSIPPNSSPSFAVTKFIEFMTDRENLIKQKTGRTIPILVSEAGYHGSNEQLGADYITELYGRAATVPFIEGIWWYELEDSKKGRSGLLRSNNTKKPAFAAYKAAAE